MSIFDSTTANTAISRGITVTSGGGSSVKGAWVEAFASISEEAKWIQVNYQSSNADENFAIDIGVGAAGSEVVVIADNPIFFNNSAMINLQLPRTIASGSRVSVRCKATIASATMRFMMYLSNDATFGTSTQNTTIQAGNKGIDIDPGAVDNTKGAYTELIASTPHEFNYMVIFLANSDNNTQTGQNYLVDIAIGAAASEVDVIANLPFVSNGAELITTVAAFFETIASGTRISARCQSSNAVSAGSNDRLMDIAIGGYELIGAAGGGGIAHIVGQGGIVG